MIMDLLNLCDSPACKSCRKEKRKPVAQRWEERRDAATSLMERYLDAYRPDFGLAAEFARLSLEANAVLLGVSQ
jgi:hypothetical protein